MPSRQAVSPYRLAIARLGRGIGVTVSPLVGEVYRQAGALGRPAVGRMAKAALLVALLEEEGLPAIPGALAALFGDLGWQGVGPAPVEALAGEGGSGELATVARLYRRYLGLLARLGLADRDQLCGRALRRLADGGEQLVVVAGSIDDRVAFAQRAFARVARAVVDVGGERGALMPLGCASPLEEAEVVAQTVLARLEEGRPALLVARRVAAAALRLQGPLAQRGIHLSFQTTFPLLQTPAGSALRGALLAARGEGEADDLLALLRLTGEEAALWWEEAEAVRFGLEEAAELALQLEGKGEPTLAQLRAAENPYPLLADLARQLAFAIAERARARPSPLAVAQGRGAVQAAAGLEEAAALVERLGRLEASLGRAAAGLAAVEATLRSAGCPFQSLPPPTATAVALMAPWEAGGLRCAELFALGCERGLLLADPPHFAAARRLLEEAGLLFPRGEPLARERELLERLAELAPTVHLCHAQASETGRALLPEGAAVELLAAAPPARRPPAAQPFPAALGEALERLESPEGPVRATELETYLRCPNRWLIERRLALGEVAEERLDRREGMLLHELLAEVLRGLAQRRGEGGLDEGAAAEGLQLAQELLAARRGRYGGGPLERLLLAGAEQKARRLIPHCLRQLAGRRLVGVEVEFGPGRPLPPLAIGGVEVTGRIDRIDLDEEGEAVVVDYKRSLDSRSHPQAKWCESGTIQVVLYMEVARRHLALPPAAGLYQPLTGRELRPRGLARKADRRLGLARPDILAAEQFEAVLDHALTLAREAAEGLAAGQLGARPKTCSREGCAYPQLCRWLQGS